MLRKNDALFFIKNGFFQHPFFLQLEITDYCPLDCPQCYKANTESSYMRIDVFDDILQQASIIGVEHISLNGGEPLLHPQIESFVEKIHLYGIKETVITSGCGVTSHFVQAAKANDLNISVSLNGSTPEINALSRDGFEHAMAAAKLLKTENYPFQINWVARHDNVYDLPNLVECGKDLGASSINVVCNKISATGEIFSPLTKSDYDFLVNTIKANSNYFTIQNCYGILLSLLGRPHNNLYGCQAGIRSMAVGCLGKFMPCTHLYHFETSDSLAAYWNDSKWLASLREKQLPVYCDDCGRCRFCHSVSKQSHDDFHIGYENCPVKSSQTQ